MLSLIDWNPILDLITPYNIKDLLSKIGGLQLLPENANMAIRLEALAHAVTALGTCEKLPMATKHTLNNICNGRAISGSWIESQEDPSENMVTEAFTFHGGCYVVFPGIVEDTTFILRQLCRALFNHSEALPDEFLHQATQLIHATLIVTDTVARLAGMRRGLEPSDRYYRAFIPSQRELEALARAVTFRVSKLEAELNAHNLPNDALSPLIIEAGKVNLDEYTIEEGPLYAKPFVQFGDEIVFAAPGRILASIRHAIICLAQEHGLIEKVAERYSSAVWYNVCENFDWLKMKQVDMNLPNLPADFSYKEGVFYSDTDKVCYALLIVDNLSDYSPTNAYGEWKLNDWRIIEERIKEVTEHLFCSFPRLNDLLVLILHQGIGRRYAMGIESVPSYLEDRLLAFRAANLESIAVLEGGNELVLWKYLQARQDARRRMHIMSIDEINEFAHYRKYNYSYYMSDERYPDFLSIPPGFDGDLNREAYQKLDRHGVPSFNRGFVSEVVLLHGKTIPPFYVLISNLGARVAIFIEGMGIPVWVIGPEYESEEQFQFHSIYAQIADMLAYWLWQCEPSISPFLKQLPKQKGALVINLELEPSEKWFRMPELEETEATDSIMVQVHPTDFAIQVRLTSDILHQLRRADNKGERIILRQMLEGLKRLLLNHGVTEVNDWNINNIIDRHAPLGVKKKISILSEETEPRLNPENSPDFRKVQGPEEQKLLDKLGEYLIAQCWNVGEIEPDKRSKILNQAVGYLYKELIKVAATLSPERLLEWLISHHETITREKSLQQLTITPQLACWENHEEVMKHFWERSRELDTASLASRFLIEYVSSKPPNGFRTISLEVYDYLMAIALLIINVAFVSDLIHYNVFDLEVSMLPSGRLGINQQVFHQARDAFTIEVSTEEALGLSQTFARYWQREEQTQPPEGTEEIEVACREEFGHTMTEFCILICELYNLGQEQSSSVKQMDADSLCERLIQATGWAKEKLTRMLDWLYLCPRNDFLNPPPPYRKEDVYPWRFNRPLSYLRRPLIQIIRDGKVFTLWGNRHLDNSRKYFLYLVMNGRLEAQTVGMRQLMGKFQNEKGDTFNEYIANLLNEHPELEVHPKVKKICGKNMRGPDGNELGDIDVLAIHPKRRCIWAIECKDLSPARTPSELASELNKLFRGDDKQSSVVERHLRRVEWIDNHISAVFEHYNISQRERWKVRPLIVVDEEIFSKHLYTSRIPVYSLRQLQENLSQILQHPR